MTRMSKGEHNEQGALDRIAKSIQNGLLVVDAEGQVVWMDDNTRRHINGGLGKLPLPLPRQPASIECFVTTTRLELADESRELCVLQAISTEEARERDARPVLDAIEEVLAEPTWLAQALVEKLKARLQATRPAASASDLDRLTAREREILLLVCEGRTDAEMSRELSLSHNTIRNHLASLFRKIGVNRRSAAVIWARERAITRHDMLVSSNTARTRRQSLY
ncbi:MAG: LuxR C-terminal-related transcriptional regulator [Pseudomonadota bacterium]|nr:LuxR C-terminal-related transcriptional regulator [Pseudomonadota bacterium]